MKVTKRFSLILIATVLSIPLLVTYAAGGRIEGKVTDPKGGAVPGATVTVTNQATNQTVTSVTDAQGQYKVEGLVAGTYSVKVSGGQSKRGSVYGRW